MFKNLLIALDGSDHAKQAALKAINLAKQIHGLSLWVIYVVPNAPSKTKLFDSGFNVKEVLHREAREKLAKTISLFHKEDIDFELYVAIGEPAEEIVKLSIEKNIDLIVIGSRGLNTIGEVMFGSVSHEVLHEAQCPVMVVKKEI